MVLLRMWCCAPVICLNATIGAQIGEKQLMGMLETISEKQSATTITVSGDVSTTATVFWPPSVVYQQTVSPLSFIRRQSL